MPQTQIYSHQTHLFLGLGKVVAGLHLRLHFELVCAVWFAR
jgi:hypothetical protein